MDVIWSFLAAILGSVIGAGAVLVAGHQSVESSQRLIAQQYDWDQKTRERERQALRSAVRILIHLELQHNLASLRAFWHRYIALESLGPGTPDDHQFLERWRLISKPLPVWEHRRWQSLTTELSLSLEVDELQQVQTIHSNLDALTKRREQLAELLPKGLGLDYDRLRASEPATETPLSKTDLIQPVRAYIATTQPLWSECEDLWRKLDNGDTFVL